ncbi:UBX domain-containing protein 4-like [Diadema setosum]|uniref:UBX domain-containing protein 4-like n=1 Tax=Diadema setosum TaxID=31175 RepID=UPI003B3ACB53
MRWFGGNISGAITQAREQKKIMLVYITGTNDDSKKMDEVWEEEAVMVACNETGVIALRFQADSPESQQFSAYYPVICVPCVYLISGPTGILLESIAGYKPSSDLVKKIRDVTATVTVPQQPAAPSNPQPETAPPDIKKRETTEAAAEQGASSTPSASSSSPSEPVKESAHERAARMRQKMEEVHRKKEQQRKEVEKQREMERRKTGQEIQKADKQRSEQQAKQLAEEIRKQRQDDKVAREKVLQQLARDKAEKEARFRSEKEQREKQKQRAQQQQEEAQRAEQARRDASLMETARIQFRLPDGSTLTKQFSSNAPLQEALDFVSENVGAGLPEFTLSTTYPRRNFGPSDMQLSFSSLELVPRAAIVVLPGRLTPTSGQGSSSQVATSEEGGIFSWLLAPFLFIYNLILNIFFGSAAPAAGSTSPSSAAATSSPQSATYTDSSADRLSRTAGARPKSSYARRRTPASGAGQDSFSRREGNIHRLNTQQQDDDDNNTWNGNSTQQM